MSCAAPITPAASVEGLFDALVRAAVDRAKDELRAELGASPWLDANGAAEYLSVPVKRIRNLTSAREIPHRKQGGRVLYHRAELDAWLDDHYEGPSRYIRRTLLGSAGQEKRPGSAETLRGRTREGKSHVSEAA